MFALVLLDLSSAFYMVDHDILLQVLDKKFGVKDNSPQWFDRYLRLRWFTVCVNGTYSSKKEISLSVPQGLINGPVLFNSYSSTIQSVIDESIKINAFADDHSLPKDFSPIPTEEITVVSHLENNLDENCLKLNPGKTEFILCYKLIFSRTESIFVRKTSFRLISVKTSSGLRKMFSQYYYNQNGVWENVCPTILDTHFH